MDQSSSGGRKGPSNRNQNRRRSGGGQTQNRNPRKPAAKKNESLGSKILGFFGFGKKSDNRKPSNNRQSSRPSGERKSRRPAEIAEPTSGRLYIGNLEYGVKGPDLADLFKKAGNVVSAEVISNPHNGRSKGFGFVEMGSIEDAKNAVQSLQGQELNGRKLLVSGAKGKPGGGDREPRRQQGDRPPRRDSSSRRSSDRPRNDRERKGRKRYDDEQVERKPRKVETITGTVLKIANLNTEATEDDLREAFRDISPVTSVKLAEEESEKGTARVEFASVEEAQHAVNILHGKSLMGQPLALTGES